MTCPTCGRPNQRGVSLDYTGRRLLIGDHEIPLTGREADVLLVLMEKIGGTISRDVIIRKVWGIMASEWAYHNIDVYVARIRRKLAEEPVKIKTTRGSGFALVLQ